MEKPIICPRCRSEALNKSGKTPGGKQRFVCLVCGRQFVADNPRPEVKNRPPCPICGKKMHIHATYKTFRRLRCSRYPACRSFVRVQRERNEP